MLVLDISFPTVYQKNANTTMFLRDAGLFRNYRTNKQITSRPSNN